ncbi:hypothetical protein ON010_g9731 [Phytophthora cinnamomi]|nr:hypothetical protein ON010_g9731 [Phytophthora cinnamomi]
MTLQPRNKERLTSGLVGHAVAEHAHVAVSKRARGGAARGKRGGGAVVIQRDGLGATVGDGHRDRRLHGGQVGREAGRGQSEAGHYRVAATPTQCANISDLANWGA